MPKQTAINGYPIIESTSVPRTRDGAQGYVVIVDRGTQSPRYVASLWFEGDGSWCQGHYINDLGVARQRKEKLIKLYS